MSAMLPNTTSYKHVRLDEEGVPYIADSTMKVVELVMAQKAYGWSPEELHFQHPYLKMSQIHSALAYYWEHKAVLDDDIEQRLALADQARKKAPNSLLAERLHNLSQRE